MESKFEKFLLKKSADNTRVDFDLYFSKYELSKLIDRLPEENEAYKMISPAGGWSSCSLVLWIASQCKINDLFITTLRVGQKELESIVRLKENGDVGNICFLLSGLSKENVVNGKDYCYGFNFEKCCKKP